MSQDSKSPFSASEQGLGYIFQPRFALLKILSLPEDSCVLIEKDDDLEFSDVNGQKSLASLKHKAKGQVLTDLSTDFWKSLRIWLKSYTQNGGIPSSLRFFLFTTASVSETSFLSHFLHDAKESDASLLSITQPVLDSSRSAQILPIKSEFNNLSEKEKSDFLSRIIIFDDSPRITELPRLIIDQHLRTIPRLVRESLFQRLEGWWCDLMIKMFEPPRICRRL